VGERGYRILVALGGRALEQAGGLGGVARDSVAVRVRASQFVFGRGEALLGGKLDGAAPWGFFVEVFS
jgi:hypothetical protein